MRGRLGIEVVPIHLILDGVEYRDDLDLTAEDAHFALARSRVYASAAPTMEEWHTAFERLIASGHESILVVVVSRKLSSTFDSARLAASTTAAPVLVVDSGTATAAEGLLVRHLAELAQEGMSLDELEAFAQQHSPGYHFVAAIHRLDRLGRSGRMPAILAALGDRVELKPLLELREGLVRSRLAVRTFDRAKERVLARVLTAVPEGVPARIVVTHAGLPAEAEWMAGSIGADRPLVDVSVAPFSPVMVANTGPILGVAWEDPALVRGQRTP